MSKKPQTTGQCPGCEKKKKLLDYNETQLCMDCSKLADALINEQNRIDRLKKIAGSNKPASSCELPEVLDAVRYRTRDRDQNSWYVSISEMEGAPVEIFASTAFDRDQHLQSRISNLTTITRLISLILRHISLGEKLTLEKTLTQLHRSSRQRNDLPEMLVTVLQKYSKRPDEITRNEHETP